MDLDSRTSHKPPSSDGYQKKTVKPGLPKTEKAKGGQKGHVGKTLKRVERPDHIKVHLPEQCVCCQRFFASDETYEIVQSRQVFDLPEPKLIVIEHCLGQVACCGLSQCGDYPPHVTAVVQYGPGVRAFATQLSVDYKMPLEQISQLFEDLYGYALNSATVEEALERAYVLAEPIEAQSVAQLKIADCAHFDETGLRVAGKLHWLHVAATATLTHVFVHEKRGMAALTHEASVLKDFHGVTVHDCWSPYFNFTSARHVLCGAHLLRELWGLRENGSAWAEAMHGFLLELHNMPRPVTDPEVVRLRYGAILDQADQAEPPPQTGKRGKPKQSKGRNLLNRLRAHEDGVLAFALEAGIPFTNNQAERDVRPAKVKQKVSGCFRTQAGAQVYARIQAVISTFRKQNLKVFATLRDLFSSSFVLVA